jgi:glycosyltransferase involved in cell wall biosynthesis
VRRGCRYDVGFYAPWVTPRLAERPETGGTRPGLGGAETQVMLLSRALAERGLSVCLAVSDVPGIDVPASDHGVDIVVRPPEARGGGIVGQLREVAALRAAVRAIDARVVITRCPGYSIGLVGLWTKLSRRQFVYTSASLGDFKYESVLTKRRDRLLFRLGVALADKIVVQTEEQIELCERRFGRAPIFIRDVSEPEEQSEHEREAFLWAGRAEANKQPLEYVELARSLPDARFWMVARASTTPGGKELWTQIEHAARTLPNLELLPPRPRPELLELMARAVAVVSTSGFEGMPNVFLEGWSRGIPALALNHDPDGIIARHGLGGFAQGRRDRLIELARDLWDSRTAQREYATRCRAYVRNNHSPERVSADWARALHLADNGRGPRRPRGLETG